MKLRIFLATAAILPLTLAAAPITGVNAIGSNSIAANRSVGNLVNGSGLNSPGNPDDPAAWQHEGGTDTFGSNLNWLADARGTAPLPGVANHWAAFDVGSVVDLSSMNVFNFGVSSGGNNARGTGTADVYYRSDSYGTNSDGNNTAFDNTGWTLLGTETFTIGPSGGFQGADNVDLTGVTARYIAIDVLTSQGDANFVGLGEVQFFEVPAGPVLAVDGGSPDPDFIFGNVFGPAAPTRTVQYTANSSGADTITIQSVTVTDDGGGVFGSPTVTYSGTNVLSNGDSVSIEVPVILGSTGAAAGILDIDTTSSAGEPNFNDKSLALSATLFSSGQKLNDNGSFASGLSGWDGDSIAVSPGVAPGSSTGARVRGVGDPSSVIDTSAYQTAVPDGASDWEFSAYFTPAAASEFGDYAGTTIPSADGSFTDRTFQWVLLGSDTPSPAGGFDDSVMANAIINLAYLPDGITSGGTPDFYVFDGTAGANGTWTATGIGAIAGSIDDDNDGNLDGGGDTLNVYRLTVKGTGFGNLGASYDVSVTKVAGPDSFTSGSATSLGVYHGLDGNTATPAAHGFTTNDVSLTSNFGDGTDQGLATPFWIDDVCLFNIAGPDPALTVASTPDNIVVAAPATSGTASFSIRNDGSATNLDIDSISFAGGTGFSVVSPSIPASIAPGTIQAFVIEWDSATASDTFETTTITAEDTGNGLSADLSLKAGLSFGGFVVLDYNDHVLGNMAQAANDGTGIGFTEASWNGGTGTQQIIAGDLDVTTVPGYSVPATGTPQSQTTNNTVGRQQERQIDIGDGINPVWFSFLAQKPTSAGRVGIGFNDTGVTSLDPRVVWLNNAVQYRAGGGNNPQVTLNAPDSTVLFVGRITINDLPTGEDRVEVWVNPSDMSSVAALGAPDINFAGNNSLGDGLTSLNPSVYGATGADAPILDNVRLSDLSESAAFDVIRTGVVPIVDPVLEVDGGSADPDFNHGNIFLTGSSSRSMTFVNNSDSGSETITINSVVLTDDAGGVFGTPIVSYSGTNVLGNGDTVTITVPASAATGVYTGVLTIDTLSTGLFDPNNNDMVLPLSVSFYAAGEKLNDNGFFDAGLAGWGGGSAAAPGIAPGSINGARVIGAGDPSGGFSSSLFQADGIPDGAPDWEFTAYFTPASATVFGDYAGSTIPGADGSFTDRTFQWVLLGADTPRPDDGTPDIGFDDTVMANSIVNIAYLPDGNTSGGTPDFYVFDGTAGANGTWVATGIGAIEGSIDADDDADPSNGIGDGDLDDTTDTVNVYRLRVVGSGFGSAGATYDVSVSKVFGADPFTSGSAAGLTTFHGLSGDTNAPAAHGFATNDVSTTSNFGDGTDQGLTTPFWVDDACLFAGSAPDPNLVVVGAPDVLNVFAPDTDTTATFLLRNDGATLGLDISSVTLTGTGFSLLAPSSFPASIPPNGGTVAELLFDSTAIAPANAAIALMTINSNDPNEPALEFPLSGAATSFSKLIANEGFEVAGFDDTTDTDTFAVWTELNTPAQVTDVPGLDDTTMTAAYVGPVADGIGGVTQLFGAVVNNFEVQTDFAIRDAASGIRQFSFEIESAPGNNGGRMNLRYQAGAIWMFNNVASQGSTGWQSLFPATLTPSVDSNGDGDFNDPGESSAVYTLIISATNWGYASLSYDVTVLDSGGGTVGSATGVGFVQNAVPDGGAERVISRNEFGGNPGFWVDDMCASGSVVILDPGPINITAFDIDPATGLGTVTFDSVDGAPYTLAGSDDVNDADLFNDPANIIGTTAGVGTSTTLPFSDPDAIGKDTKAYRVQSP